MKPAAQQIAEIDAARTDRRFAVSHETVNTPEELARWIDNVSQGEREMMSTVFSAIRHFEPTAAELGAAIQLLAERRE